ncbi:2040_t:CDS:2, partial [Dentiscutata erythropus]
QKYLLDAYHIQQQKMAMNLTIIQDQQSSISDESITPSMSASNYSIVSNNNYFTHLPIDAYESNKLLLEGIIEGGTPFSFVDSKKFKQFVYSINTNYHVPARRQLSKNVLNDVYKKVQMSIQQFICKSNWISIATDGWTNLHQDHIINFMAIGKNRRSANTVSENQHIIEPLLAATNFL